MNKKTRSQENIKKLVKLFGIIALAAIAGFSFIACDNPAGGGDANQPGGTVDPALNGLWHEVWYNNDRRFSIPFFLFNNGNFQMFADTTFRGTYYTNKNLLTLRFTYVLPFPGFFEEEGFLYELRWHSVAELRAIAQSFNHYEFVQEIDRYLVPPTIITYFVSDNTLTLISESLFGGSIRLYRE